ncbi:unnamed protein product [Orchesella dallaii]|uniref:Dynamin GTPase n=1 Tax=Orchesella dallaii TaxID=48710 RepID=A0ABP1R1V5_9HEXA
METWQSSNSSDSDDDSKKVYNQKKRGSSAYSKSNSQKGFDHIMQMMNELYDVFASAKLEGRNEIDLPKLVVCGSQSSGKTSVLESIVGEEFLPRGNGIQTRCPIILQLNHTQGTSKWIQFAGERDKYEDFNEVKKILKAKSDEIARTEVISKDPITISIHSPYVVDLTLIDLPGLIENAVEGQPQNLVRKVQRLVNDYISSPNCIILAVTSAVTDIADSKCIRLAKEVDPNGTRTLAVLTKLDMMDEGTDASDVLSGKIIKFNLGIIGVVNRSFKDTEVGRSVSEGLEKERNFLQENYPDMCDKNGIPYLIEKTTELLKKKIERELPRLKSRIDEMIKKGEEQAFKIGGVTDPEEKRKLIFREINKFTTSYNGQVDGRRRDLSVDYIYTSTKIKEIFNGTFERHMNELEAEAFTDTQIETAMRNSGGLHTFKEGTDDTFQELAKRAVRKMKRPVFECNKLVLKEMIDTIDSCLDSDVITRYPKLGKAITEVVTKFISEKYESCSKYLSNFMLAEGSFAKTSKHDFLKQLYAAEKVGPVENSNASDSDDDDDDEEDDSDEEASPSTNAYNDDDSESEADDSEDTTPQWTTNNTLSKLRELIKQYFELTKIDIKDHVPKAIATQLVYAVVDDLSEELNMKLTKDESIENLLREPEEKERERNKAIKFLQGYKEAKALIEKMMRNVNN